MRRYLLAGLGAVVFGLAAPASAADLPARRAVAPVAVAPVFSWTGFYIGVNAGYSWGETDYQYAQIGLPNTFVGTLNPEGFIGGGQIGFNWQTGAFVFGVEGDFAWRDASDFHTRAFANGIDFADFGTDHNWVATLRGRLGIAFTNWLIYATGGIAFGDFDHFYTERRPGVAARTISSSETKTGWTFGGGVEFGFGAWSFGVEYLFMDFEDTTIGAPTELIGGLLFPASATTFEDQSHVIRAKLNYRFGPTVAPVVARN
jgi:outer membrane immunogenic protein